MHYNLFTFEIQISLLKVGFYFLLSIVLEKWLLMVFIEFFLVNIRLWIKCKLLLSFSRLERD